MRHATYMPWVSELSMYPGEINYTWLLSGEALTDKTNGGAHFAEDEGGAVRNSTDGDGGGGGGGVSARHSRDYVGEARCRTEVSLDR